MCCMFLCADEGKGPPSSIFRADQQSHSETNDNPDMQEAVARQIKAVNKIQQFFFLSYHSSYFVHFCVIIIVFFSFFFFFFLSKY